MAEPEEDAAAALERLEAALERLAALAARRSGAPVAEPAKAELAGRLDALIAQLRAALDGAGEAGATGSE